MMKRLLHLTRERLNAYIWNGGRIEAVGSFTDDEAGREGFRKLMGEGISSPVSILLDLVEEDFHPDTVPHLRGRDRHALFTRKLDQLYRTTPYRHVLTQGRNRDGRRDDRILLSGLTNASPVKPWVDALTKARVPIAGIFSAPLLSGILLKKLDIHADHLLLVTFQGPGLLRQTYFQESELRFSRLLEFDPESETSLAQRLDDETGKTRGYLNTQRMMPRDGILSVIVLCDPAGALSLREHCQDNALVRYEFHPLPAAAAKLGIVHPDDNPHAVPLYLRAAVLPGSGNHYAPKSLRRHYRVWQAQWSIFFSGFVLAIASLAWSGSAVQRGWNLENRVRAATTETLALQARHGELSRGFPQTGLSTEDLKSAVLVGESLLAQPTSPADLWRVAGQALSAHPAIQVTRLSWANTNDPEYLPTGIEAGQQEDPVPGENGIKPKASPPPAGAPSPPPASAATAGSTGKYQVLVVSAELAGFHGSQRAIMAEVQAFMDSLHKAGTTFADGKITIRALQRPVKIGPQASVRGVTGLAARENTKLPLMVRLTLERNP